MIESCLSIEEMANNLKKSEGRIDVIKIANNLGIKVFSTNEIVASFIAFDAEINIYEIYVNSKETKERQRFSIAHEIAHFIEHRDKIQQFGLVGRQNDHSLSAEEENRADELAGRILMPHSCIFEYLKTLGIMGNSKISDSDIIKIAKEFEVSMVAAIIRLREIGFYVRYI